MALFCSHISHVQSMCRKSFCAGSFALDFLCYMYIKYICSYWFWKITQSSQPPRDQTSNFKFPSRDKTKCRYHFINPFSISTSNCFWRPVNGGWSNWGNWEPRNGSRTDLPPKYRNRTRKCTNPPPQNDGTKCDGSSVDIELCCLKKPGECVTVDSKRKHLNFTGSVAGSYSNCSLTLKRENIIFIIWATAFYWKINH